MSERPVCLITGANTGIGEVTARELARDGMHVFMACRSMDKARPVMEAIQSETGNEQVEFLPLELGELDSVRACAQQFLERGLPLQLLINNAGLAGKRGLSASGFEVAFGVNHLGPFLLTELLMERIRESGPARIVNVASKAHYRASGLDWEALQKPTRGVTGVMEYSVSKLANVLHAAELARRLEGTAITSYSLHPGVVATDVWREVPQPLRWLLMQARGMLTPEQGAQTTLHCARSAEASEQSGRYYHSSKPKEPSPQAQDPALAAELWERSLGWVDL